ncbi:hypothetical protein ACFWP7_25340 [Streptomyces sp. NPDC058470]|uniref:hypothetical protein n=1 Tax=Streptomyces sp. NPDC058470 TaxID=3346515 RepID=UPI003657C754
MSVTSPTDVSVTDLTDRGVADLTDRGVRRVIAGRLARAPSAPHPVAHGEM